jgi:hypothetical protein
MLTTIYGCTLALVPLEPVEATVVDAVMFAVLELVEAPVTPTEAPPVPVQLKYGLVRVLTSPSLIVWLCPESVAVVVAVCVWLTTVASLEPPVSSSVSNSASP